MFQKWTVFVVTESWSRDQVMQKKPINLFLFIFIFLEIRFHWCIQTMIQYVALSDLEY